MSEPEAEAEADPGGRGEIWIEKYRPEGLDGVVGHEHIVERLQRYVERDDLPHLMFAGPAGTGKCVTGDTPVLTSRGVEPIETVVGDCDGYGHPPEELSVLTFGGDGEFQFVEPRRVFSKEAEEVVDVSTRDGSEFTATPEHPLLVLDEAGFEWKDAADLQPGDRLARPARTPTPEPATKLDWIGRMDGERTLVTVTEAFAERHDIPVEESYVAGKKAVVEGVRRGDSTDEIVEASELTRGTVEDYRRALDEGDLQTPSTSCSLSFLRSLDVSRPELGEHVVEIQHVSRFNDRVQPITPPWEVTPELAAFVGLAITEARIDGGRIQFYNTDERLLEQFEQAAEGLFGVDVVHGRNKGVPYREINSATLSNFLRACFDVFDGATDGEGIGSTLVTADEESRKTFLRAVFDAEAYVDERGAIELTQKNEQLITLLSYLLPGLGVPSRRKTERKAATNGSGTERTYHTLYVSGAGPLSRFEEAVGFSVEQKAQRLADNTDRDPNPNHDTVPVQQSVDVLCDELYLPKQDLTTKTPNRESPGRKNYLEDAERVLEAATAKVETAQEVLERLDSVGSDVDRVASVPATWAAGRDTLEPLETRKELATSTDVRTDRLLEYADGRRTPTGDRVGALLVETETLEERPPIDSVQSVLRGSIERLAVPYNHVAEDTDLLGTDVINLFENDDHDLRTLGRFGTVVERVREVATGMLTEDVLASLRTLDTLTSGTLYFDEVESVEYREDAQRVYDLTVPDTHNYVAGSVPTVMHNTASAQAIAKELYGEDWQSFFLELNASDQRGIDVIRDQVKSFARTQMSSGGGNYRIIFLDEADALTSDAQSALRRTMEQFSSNTRFILSCNYSSQIIDPIQSRCTVFRFSPLADEAVEGRIREIAEAEGVGVTDDGVDALVYAADGDMRAAINALQATTGMRDVVDEDAVYAMTSTARPEEVHGMVQTALDGDFTAARAQLDELLTEKGMAGGDVIDQLHRGVWEFDLEDERAVRLLDRVGEADYRITEGANERIQLEALLASLALES